MLGVSCLYTNDFGGAHTYLTRSLDLEGHQVVPKLGLAVIYLRRGKITQALQEWLDVLNLAPRNPQALFGLNFARNLDDQSPPIQELDSAAKRRLYPRTGFNTRFVLPGVLVLILAVVAFAGISLLRSSIAASQTIEREGGEFLEFSSSLPRLAHTGTYSRILTEAQLNRLISDLRTDFDEYRDNEARFSINQILGSNAAEDVKTQMQLLVDLLDEPSFVDSFWSPEPEDVLADKTSYRGVFVRWMGKISNLRTDPDAVRFDFLVGYQNQDVLRAIVPVELHFAASLNPGDNIELIGQLQMVSEGILSLRGTSIRIIR